LQTALSLTPDEPYLLVEDTLTNKGSYPREYQAIYHNNFAQPILEKGRAAACSYCGTVAL